MTECAKLIERQANEHSGHDAIIKHLKNQHLHELEKMNKKFAKQLQEQKTLLEKETEQAQGRERCCREHMMRTNLSMTTFILFMR